MSKLYPLGTKTKIKKQKKDMTATTTKIEKKNE